MKYTKKLYAHKKYQLYKAPALVYSTFWELKAFFIFPVNEVQHVYLC